MRYVLESLALKYRLIIERLEALAGQSPEIIHIVVGGARNALLCQLTADTTGKPVLAGPAEATALGNILVQGLAQQRVSPLGEVREIVACSTALDRCEPQTAKPWDDATCRLASLVKDSCQRTAHAGVCRPAEGPDKKRAPRARGVSVLSGGERSNLNIYLMRGLSRRIYRSVRFFSD